MPDSILISSIHPFFLHHRAVRADSNHDGVLTRNEYEANLLADHFSRNQVEFGWSHYEAAVRNLQTNTPNSVYHDLGSSVLNIGAAGIVRQVVKTGFKGVARSNVIALAVVTVGFAVYEHWRDTDDVPLTLTERAEDVGVRVVRQLASEMATLGVVALSAGNPIGLIGGVCAGLFVDHAVESLFN